MKLKSVILSIIILSITMIAAPWVLAADSVDLTVGNGSGIVGATIEVPITVSAATGIAGASFTVKYNNASMSVEDVASTFFDTFANQFAAIPAAPTSVTVDTTLYTQPLITNPVDEIGLTGMRIAAARAVAAGPSNVTLFTLHVKLLAEGIHPISIVETVLNNPAAGYQTDTAIPYLVGATDSPNLADAFPEIVVDSLMTGNITVATDNTTDSDGDGVPDSSDAFPNDPNESQDSDSDSVGDNADAFPNDPGETTDSDNDGTGDNADLCDNDPNKTSPGNCGCGLSEDSCKVFPWVLFYPAITS